MTNSNTQIFNNLKSEKDNLFNILLNTTITDELLAEYNDIDTGKGYRAKDDDPDVVSIRKYLKDETLDSRFQEAVNNINKVAVDLIIEEFRKCWLKIFALMQENRYEFSAQALFIEYDYYGHKHAWVGAFGKWDWKIMDGSIYLSGNWHENKIFELPTGITFKNAWPANAETEFEKIDDEVGLDVSNRLINLYQLNSRILLHESLQQLDKEGQLNFLCIKPFYFYVNQHDSEISSLYIKK